LGGGGRGKKSVTNMNYTGGGEGDQRAIGAFF